MTVMRGVMRIGVAMMLAVAPAMAAQAAPAKRAAAVDWSTRIAVTPIGSYVRGNPQAKVKLVEYASFTCSHCAAFQMEGVPALMPLIRSGQVSLEQRNAIRDRFDLAAALLARCTGPAGYVRAADAIFRAQADWLGKAATMAEPAATQSMNDALGATARAVGLDRLAVPGMAPAKVNACIADTAEQGRLTRMREEAWSERRISGTPFFLVNGQAVQDVYDWAALEPVIRAALAK